MNDDDLRRLLRNSLSGRQAPTEVRERLLLSLRPRRALAVWGALAATLLLAAAAFAWGRKPAAPVPNPLIARAVEQHLQSPVFGHAASTATPREVAQTLSEASGREIEMPGLRDVGFTQMQAHRCEGTGWAHVIYANSWLKVSCFILDAATLDLAGGTPGHEPGIDATQFEIGPYSAVVVREAGLAKIWVADLRGDQLASIAVDAEQKRHQLKTTVFSVNDKAIAKPLGAMLQSTIGVEDFHLEASKQEAYVKYDRRRVTPEEIAALLVTNGFAASPRDWGGR